MELEARCPAAELLRGAMDDATVICGVMKRRFQLIDSILGGAERGVALYIRDDPSSILGLCCGTDLPVTGKEQVRREVAEFGRTKSSYTVCPIWLADRELDWAFKRRNDSILAGEYDEEEDTTAPTLVDLIYGRASIEEWAETYAGPVPQDWTEQEEREWTGEAEGRTRPAEAYV